VFVPITDPNDGRIFSHKERELQQSIPKHLRGPSWKDTEHPKEMPGMPDGPMLKQPSDKKYWKGAPLTHPMPPAWLRKLHKQGSVTSSSFLTPGAKKLLLKEAMYGDPSVGAALEKMARQITGMSYDPNNANIRMLKKTYGADWKKVLAQRKGVDVGSIVEKGMPIPSGMRIANTLPGPGEKIASTPANPLVFAMSHGSAKPNPKTGKTELVKGHYLNKKPVTPYVPPAGHAGGSASYTGLLGQASKGAANRATPFGPKNPAHVRPKSIPAPSVLGPK